MIDAKWIPVILAFMTSLPFGTLCAFWLNRLSKGSFVGALIGFISSIATTFIFSLPSEPYNFYIFFCYGISTLAMWTVFFLTSRSRLGLFTSLGFVVIYSISSFGLFWIRIFGSVESLPWQALLSCLSIFSFIAGCLVRLVLTIFASRNSR